jgi:pilus assembly protein CpaE
MALKLWLTGDWRGLDDLRDGLAQRPEFELANGRPDPAGGVIVHATLGNEVPRDELAALREHSRAPVVLLAGGHGDGLVGAAAAAELADVLILPQLADAVAFAALKAAAAVDAPIRAADTAPGRVVTVFSPKGGTGKSVTACNLAVALAGEGHRTLLVDLDLQFGDTAIMLGLEPERTLHDLLSAPGLLDAEKIAGYATRHESGLDVLPAPVRPEDGELVSDGRVAELIDAARSGYDLVVVDSSPFFHGALLAALDRTDTLLLLCAPDVPTLKNVRLALQTLELISFPPERVRLVLNRASSRVGFRAQQVSSVLERRIDVELPEDETAAVGVNRGTPAVLLKAESPYARAVTALASTIAAGPADEPVPSRKRLRLALGRRS